MLGIVLDIEDKKNNVWRRDWGIYSLGTISK